MTTKIIKGFHAHVYFDHDTVEPARELCQQAEQMFPIKVGRMHQKPVGPHPCWSCQLAFPSELLGEIIPWLALHRGGLTIFIHPETGNDLKDHTDHAIWMGTIEPLKLEVFST
ncbi:MAG: DOPA 4,5-dioxygenase family protein [Cyanothece sp. SIO2G6]|nr:DOPA 4,5-dioxygenase family protein [Cyanothece sp. SIO2G6]